jgi:hypothetical protein
MFLSVRDECPKKGTGRENFLLLHVSVEYPTKDTYSLEAK